MDRGRIAEPIDRVEAVAEIGHMLVGKVLFLSGVGTKKLGKLPGETIQDIGSLIEEAAREILKLFPEYEPVELEALGNEEIMAYARKRLMLPEDWSEATIQHNQKGQLFRVKEVK